MIGLLIQKSIMSKTNPNDTIDVVFVNGQRATYTKLFVEEHMQDPMTKRIIDNATGEIIYDA